MVSAQTRGCYCCRTVPVAQLNIDDDDGISTGDTEIIGLYMVFQNKIIIVE